MGKIEGKSNGSLIFLLVLKWKIYINISFTCTKMSKLSVLQSQLAKLPRCIYTGETKDLRKVLGALSDSVLSWPVSFPSSYSSSPDSSLISHVPLECRQPEQPHTDFPVLSFLFSAVSTCCLINLHEIPLSSCRSSVLKFLMIVPNVH